MESTTFAALMFVGALACVALAHPVTAFQSQPAEGFLLLAPQADTNTYLLDNNATVLHTWPSEYKPGATAYLLENGNVLRMYDVVSKLTGPPLYGGGGAGGGLQELAWDGTVVWDFRYSDEFILAHHDAAVLPDGNVLLIAWETISSKEAIAAGRDPGFLPLEVLFPGHIIEIERGGKTGAAIVWEWHAMDHLVQDIDPTKANFGGIADNSQLIDFNYPPFGAQSGDWLHMNSVSYNPVHDQICLSPRSFHEIWVIDHSTTTAEAASHTGGRRDKGGDLLYRWGNPQAYESGQSEDQQLFGQHDANWVEPGFPGAGNIVLFNNGPSKLGPQSSIDEIVLPVDAEGNFPVPPAGRPFGPSAPVWQYFGSPTWLFFSQLISGAVRLENGNTIACVGLSGWIVEVDPEGNVVWEHYNQRPSVLNPAVFKIRRYERFLFPEANRVSASAGATIDYHLVAGTARAGRPFAMLASMSGTEPGTLLPGGLVVPLNFDSLTTLVCATLNGPMFSGFLGTLDSLGNADAQLVIPPGLDVSFVGVTVNFAFATIDSLDFTSNAMPLHIDP